MTEPRRCGYPLHRCRGCSKPVAKDLTTCPACSSEDIDRNGSCRNRLGPEARVCHEHGGRAPQITAARDRRIARRQAEGALGQLLEELGEPADAPHPLEGLPDAYGRAWLMVTALDLLTRDLASPLGVNRHDEQVVHPLVALHGEWLDRWARIQKLTLDAGLDQRRQTLDELQVSALFDAISRASAPWPASADEFRRRLAEELRRADTLAPR